MGSKWNLLVMTAKFGSRCPRTLLAPHPRYLGWPSSSARWADQFPARKCTSLAWLVINGRT